MKNEGDVKKRVKKLLDQHEWFYWMPPANGYGRSGISDFNALRAGVFLAIETKFGANKPTAMQIGYLNSIRAEGGFAFIVSDRTIDWLEKWLDAFDHAAGAVARHEMVQELDGATMLDAIRAMTEMI